MIDPTQQAVAAPEMAPEAAAPDMSAGYVIEIRCTPDGLHKVGVEPMTPEMAEADDSQFQEVANIGEAMKLVREIAAHAGNMVDTKASDDAMAAGYGNNA